MIKDLKSRGRRIGMTHGAFDLFHYSHLDLLRKTSDICDFLIVGVDSNDSVSKYKDYKRPIIDQEYRIEIINELNCVDAVFIKDLGHDDESHVNLYRKLMVDVLTIGKTFAFKDKIDYEASKSGATLINIDTDQSHSTTRIIESIITASREDDFREVPKDNLLA